MQEECMRCQDRDRGSDRCALQPLWRTVGLVINAALQDESEYTTKMPMEALAITISLSQGNIPAQELDAYWKRIDTCVAQHNPQLPHAF